MAKSQPAKISRCSYLSDELIGLDDKKFTYYDEFQKYVQRTRNGHLYLILSVKGETLDIPVQPDTTGATWNKQIGLTESDF